MFPKRWSVGLLAALALGGVGALRAFAEPADAKPHDDAHDVSPADAPIDFGRDIRPILNDKCFHCHGPDEKSRKAKLRLDDRDNVLKKEAFIPGNPAESEIVLRITSKDPDDMMPPEETHQKITPAEVEKITRWIKQGAKYTGHWAFTNPMLPVVPKPADGSARIANPIDAFIVQKLSEIGLKQSPPADRGMLLRRVSLDLTGIPPTPDELKAYLADESSAAYEHAVDRLLASPRFGERWARMWLDLARYADSTGLGMDVLRPYMWPYRSWVIDAFNRNEPYDQFTIDQLAGDLLPNATEEQKLATAFHRNTPANMEGGTPDEEYRVAAVKDRTNTTIQVWMGLTMGCAQCHTHKFDPITINDYYSTVAIFNQSEDADLKEETPRLPVKVDESVVAITRDKAKKRVETLQKQYDDLKAKEAAKAKGAVAASEKSSEAEAETAASGSSEETAAKTDARKKPATQSPLEKLQMQLEQAKTAYEESAFVAVPVMADLPADKRRETHIMLKGNYLMPGDKVEPALPASFGSKLSGSPSRLDLARWLVDQENPLTARVAANRFWAQIFGIGLVETEEDFGTQGSMPTHPELLDWLAVTFRTPKDKGGLGWDMKALLKLIVSSETYRQASVVTPESVQKDARNLLLSYYPRRRLDAEGLRDQALSLAGLLSKKIGGPSVFPPQPDGLWQVSFNAGSKNEYVTSKGEDRHRRGIYTVWRRIAPHPAMTTLDAPPRDVCTIRRLPTNTPLQAFVMLNDPQFVEAAQGLARRILTEGGTTVPEQMRYAIELCTSRPPTNDEVAVLQSTYEDELATFEANKEDAVKAASDQAGPLPEGMDPARAAAMTSVASVLLNLDAVLTKN